MSEQQTPSTAPEASKAEEKRKGQRANSAYVYAELDGKLTWDFGSIGKLTFDPDKVSATNRARAMKHGFKQRIIDAAALDADTKTGKTDPQAKFNEMQRMIEHLESGTEDWNLKPSAGSTGPASYVTKALVALKTYQGFDVSDSEKANAFVKRVAENPKFGLKGEMGKARTWLEANSKIIREKIAELRASEAAPVDADAELAALMASDAPEETPAESEPNGQPTE